MKKLIKAHYQTINHTVPTIVLALSIVCLFFSCGEDSVNVTNSNDQLVLERYEDGTVKKSQLITGDLSYAIISFTSDGRVLDSIPFINGVENGIGFKHDFEKGVRYIYEFINGQMEGDVNGYYMTGAIYCKGQMFQNRRVGTWLYYTKDGRVEQFEVRLPNNSIPVYIKVFSYADEVPSVSLEGGCPILFSVYSDTLPIKSEAVVDLTIMDTPPEGTIKLFCGQISEDGRNFDDLVEIIYSSSRFDYPLGVISEGINQWSILYEVYDSISDSNNKGRVDIDIMGQ